MQRDRTCLVAAICALGLAGCFTDPGDLGWDDDNDAGAPGAGATSAGTGGTSGTGTGGTGAGTGGTGAGTGGTGAGGTGPSCSNAPACGGDVVGTWEVASSCLELSGDADVTSIGLGCSSIPVTGQLAVTGTWTAYGDGTYSDETVTSGNAELEVPEPCLSISGTVIECRQMGDALEIMGYTSVTCIPATGGGCTCDAVVEQHGGMGVISFIPGTSGEYTVVGDVLTTLGDVPAEYAYCASGTDLAMRPITSTAGTITGTIELVKQ
jgi:hypothetical protein